MASLIIVFLPQKNLFVRQNEFLEVSSNIQEKLLDD